MVFVLYRFCQCAIFCYILAAAERLRMKDYYVIQSGKSIKVGNM